MYMEPKEIKDRINAMIKLNKTIHTSNGATVENIRRLNYLIIETVSKGCAPKDIYSRLCSGIRADRARYDLLCRVTEQIKYPSLVYSPDVTYTDDLKTIKNSALDESRVRSSNWLKSIRGLYDITEKEAYRFTQCYMLLEQYGREEYVIDETVSIVNRFHKGYIPPSLIGKSYHNREIEIDKKAETISKLIYCDLKDYRQIEAIFENGCHNLEDYGIIRNAYESGRRFFALKTYFDSRNIRGVQGDTGTYVFQKVVNGLLSYTNKHEAYSMSDAARRMEDRCAIVHGKLGAYVNTDLYECRGELHGEPHLDADDTISGM